ncbi:MAG TPA: hypothetical protein VKA46_00220 [Gemmataceae bacterium]|nr:hypothetical protein [Gemmataceae bacterium]
MCRRIVQPDGSVIIACSRGDHRPRARHCAYCPRPVEVLCDGPPQPGSKSKTCDKGVCRVHAHVVGPDVDLCWQCFRDRQRAEREAAAAAAGSAAAAADPPADPGPDLGTV